MPSAPYHIDIHSLSPVVEAAGLVDYPSGVTVGPRTIRGYEIIYIASGKYVIDVLDHSFTLAPTDVLIMPPNVSHRYCSAGASSSHYYVYFFLSPADKKRIDRARGRVARFSDIMLSATYLDALPMHVPAFPREKEFIFSDIVESRNDLNVRSLAAAVIVLKERTLRLLREVLSHAAGVGSARESQFAESVRRIDTQYEKEISVADLSALEGLTPNYYSTRFKALYGVAPMEYVAMRRITAAKELMHTGLSLRDIAARTGYRDQYYFSNVFRKIAGMSPSEYRRLVLHAGPHRRG